MNTTPSDTPKKEFSFLNEMKLNEFVKGSYTPMRNGYQLRCPFIPPLITQQVVEPDAKIVDLNAPKTPKIVQTEQPKLCSLGCPLFKMEHFKDKKEIQVQLGCGSGLMYNIKETDVIPFQQKA